jgi:hypothetical protein
MLRGLMQRIIALAATTSLAFAAEPPAKDRQAILAMAGTHAVTFEFHETAAIAPGYQLRKKPYRESATEVVTIAEDTPTRIALQHLLVVPGKEGKEPHVIKHWAQIWTWQDIELLDYCGSEEDHLWRKIRLTPEQAAGTWSQLVTQIDDTPRYEGYGRWIHENGESSWQSGPTHRPLPRREYSKRDDYDYLTVTNRHTLTPNGWIHYQDNRKVVDREGEETRVLCFEAGLNSYTRTESPEAAAALAWWNENGDFWDGVRDFWTRSGEQARSTFTYSSHENGEGLSKLLDRLEKEKSAPEAVASALQPYVVSK